MGNPGVAPNTLNQYLNIPSDKVCKSSNDDLYFLIASLMVDEETMCLSRSLSLSINEMIVFIADLFVYSHQLHIAN